jgi:hemerythrin
MLAWMPEYSVGIEAIDEQHQMLFRLLNDLSESIEKKDAVDTVYLVSKMQAYAIFHFSTEERLMDKYGYPEFSTHKEEHETFQARIRDFESQIKNDKLLLAQKIRDYIADWIVKHLIGTDKKLAPFLLTINGLTQKV